MHDLEPLKKRLGNMTPAPWKAVGFQKKDPIDRLVDVSTGKPFESKPVFFIAGNPNAKENTSENIGQITKEYDAVSLAAIRNEFPKVIEELENEREISINLCKCMALIQVRIAEMQKENTGLDFHVEKITKLIKEGMANENKPV